MISCKRYESCNAVLCPLDENWQKHTYLRDEKICSYQAELVKDGGLERLASVLGDSTTNVIAEVTSAMSTANTHFLHRLDRAKNTSSRLA